MDRWIAASEYDALFECLFECQLLRRIPSSGDPKDERGPTSAATESREAPKAG
jgi:hypothetical protein